MGTQTAKKIAILISFHSLRESDGELAGQTGGI